jgi:hypothetical protein
MEIILKILIPILLIICSNSYSFDLSSVEQKQYKKDILNAIQRDEYLRPHFTYESSIANFAGEKQCIRIYYPNYRDYGLLKSRNSRAFKWAIDIHTKSDDVKRASELDALVKVKLLSKSMVSIEENSQQHSFIRYTLTNKGWGATNISFNGVFCFDLGMAKHLSIKSIKEFKAPYYLDIKETVYEATTIVGVSGASELPDWALDPDMRKNFPLINKLLSGYERKIMMIKDDGRWHEYIPPSVIKKMAKSGRSPSSNYYSREKPTIKKETLLKAFSFQEYLNPYWNCISLPGDSSNGVRVDKKFGSGKNYSVAIFDNKKRSKWDTKEAITKPYLEKLVRAGLLVSEHRNQIEGKKKDRGKFFSGTVYKVAQGYSHIFDEEKKCIYLGKGKVNVVDLHIIASNTRDRPHGPESVKYKYIMTFPEPPKWAQDLELQALWSDLKGALKYGKACAGTSGIDLAAITKYGNLEGSCWWAYDSVGEL